MLKQPHADGHRGVRLAIDFRWVNKFTEPTVANLDDIGELIQEVGSSCFISVFDANSGYHQTLVKESDRWLTSFVCNLGQFQWIRLECVIVVIHLLELHKRYYSQYALSPSHM